MIQPHDVVDVGISLVSCHYALSVISVQGLNEIKQF